MILVIQTSFVRIKWNLVHLLNKMRKPKKHNFFVVIAMCQVPIPFSYFFKYPFNYLTGQWFQAIVVKNWHGKQKQEKFHKSIMGVENGILLFLINEGLNWKCFHGNNFFYILVLILSCLMSTKFHKILTSNVLITWDLNIYKYKSYLWRNNFC